MSKKLLVRIHPRDKRRGFNAERYKLSGSKYGTFDVSRGWYTVDYATAKKLEKVLNNPNDPSSKPVFQVCTFAEAKAVEAAQRQVAAAANSPIPLPEGLENEVEWPEDMNEDSDLETDDLEDSFDDDESEELEEEKVTPKRGTRKKAPTTSKTTPKKPVKRTPKKPVKRTTRKKN